MTRLHITSSTECQSFKLGFLLRTFFWSVLQKNTTDLVARFNNREYELTAVETPTIYVAKFDHQYLVVETHPHFYSRIGEAEISGLPPCGEELQVRLR
jgi:hypothetical protein